MKKRHEEKLEYDKEKLELEGALQALESAITTLKASRPAAFTEMQSVLRTVQKVTFVAAALDRGTPKTRQSLSAMVTQLSQPEVPMQNYEFKLEKVIKMLEELNGEFKDELADLDEAEVKKVAAHDEV